MMMSRSITCRGIKMFYYVKRIVDMYNIVLKILEKRCDKKEIN